MPTNPPPASQPAPPRPEAEVRQELAFNHRLIVLGHRLGCNELPEMEMLKSSAEKLIEELDDAS